MSIDIDHERLQIARDAAEVFAQAFNVWTLQRGTVEKPHDFPEGHFRRWRGQLVTTAHDLLDVLGKPDDWPEDQRRYAEVLAGVADRIVSVPAHDPMALFSIDDLAVVQSNARWFCDHVGRMMDQPEHLSDPIGNADLSRRAQLTGDHVSNQIKEALRKADQALKRGGRGHNVNWTHRQLHAAFPYLPDGKLKKLLKRVGFAETDSAA